MMVQMDARPAASLALSSAQPAGTPAPRRLSPRLLAWLWLVPAIGLLAPFFLFPLALLLRYSFNHDSASGVYEAAFSFENYLRVVGDPYYAGVFANSLGVALMVAAITLALGYPFAYFIVRWSRRTRLALLWAVYTPLIVSVIVRVYGWTVITADSGLINSLAVALGLIREPWHILYEVPGMTLGLVHRYLPLVILPLVNALARIDPELLSASQSLGATPRRGFWTVTVPLSLTGVIAGFQLVLANVLSDFVLPTLMGSTRFQMIAPAIYTEAMGQVRWSMAAAMAVTVLVIVGVVFGITGMLVRRFAPWAKGN
jgi:ABC-type spermidine/putrescine transport system permease subunit I